MEEAINHQQQQQQQEVIQSTTSIIAAAAAAASVAVAAAAAAAAAAAVPLPAAFPPPALLLPPTKPAGVGVPPGALLDIGFLESLLLAAASPYSTTGDLAAPPADEPRRPMDAEVARHRAEAIARYVRKRKERSFGKKIRYDARRRLAAQRPRIRGQFVSALELEAYRAAQARPGASEASDEELDC